jgi:RNA-binding proteins (RRM domain)
VVTLFIVPFQDNSIYIYGVKFPNRLFVGGLADTVTAKDLADFFEQYGVVIEAKIVLTPKGVPKGYVYNYFILLSKIFSIYRVSRNPQPFLLYLSLE